MWGIFKVYAVSLYTNHGILLCECEDKNQHNILKFLCRHGNHQIFSCRGIEICINYFLKRGHKEITAFVPQWRTRENTGAGHETRDRHLLDELNKRGHLVFTPSRRVPGKSIVCYDDRWVDFFAFQYQDVPVLVTGYTTCTFRLNPSGASQGKWSSYLTTNWLVNYS